MTQRYKLLYFYRGTASDYPTPFTTLLEQRGWHVDPVAVDEHAKAFGVLDVFAKRAVFSRYDMLVTNEYYLTWAACLCLIGLRHPPKMAAISFNQSRRLILTSIRPLDHLLNRVWRKATMYLVHSKSEAALFGKLHDIPADNFVCSLWGCDLPAESRKKTSAPTEPYVTMVGRNNRDLDTFCKAIVLAQVAGVVITSGYMLKRFKGNIPSNVTVLTDRPIEECVNYIRGSFAHLVLVNDDQRGAGHISAVMAMFLGIPQIFSNVGPLRDYLVDEVNGLAVGIRDPASVALAIKRLKADPNHAAKLGQNGKAFARKSLSLEASASRVADALTAFAKA